MWSRRRLLPCNEGLGLATFTIVSDFRKHSYVQAWSALGPAQCADSSSVHRIWLKHLRKLLCVSFALQCIPLRPHAQACLLVLTALLNALLLQVTDRHARVRRALSRHGLRMTLRQKTRQRLEDTLMFTPARLHLMFRLGCGHMKVLLHDTVAALRLADSLSQSPTLTE